MSGNGTPIAGERMSLLEVRSISKFFGSVIALNDISMQVYAGEVTCVHHGHPGTGHGCFQGDASTDHTAANHKQVECLRLQALQRSLTVGVAAQHPPRSISLVCYSVWVGHHILTPLKLRSTGEAGRDLPPPRCTPSGQ